MTEKADRARVVAEARSWKGTPWRKAQGLKGAGVDTVSLIIRVFIDTGLVPSFNPLPYLLPSYLMMGSRSFLQMNEPLFFDLMHRLAMQEIEGPPSSGDVMAWQVTDHFDHGGIVTEWPRVVHAFANHRVVTECNAFHRARWREDDEVTRHPRRFFSHWRSSKPATPERGAEREQQFAS